MALRLLAIETSGDTCSVALALAESMIVRSEHAPQSHTRRLLPMVDEVLADAGVALSDLDAIAFGCGPGSFTGLRIAAAAAQGLAYGCERPIIPVSTLAALAQSIAAPKVAAAVDARRDQVYWGAYVRDADGIPELVGTEHVLSAEEVPPLQGTGWVGLGSGWDRYSNRLWVRQGASIQSWQPGHDPDARHVAALALVYWRRGAALVADDALPVYLRDDVAKPSGNA